MTPEEEKELQRQSLLLESLAGQESFRLWRKEVCEPILAQLEMKIAQQETLSEAVLRGNVIAKYLLNEIFYQVFDRVKAANQQEREQEQENK